MCVCDSGLVSPRGTRGVVRVARVVMWESTRSREAKRMGNYFPNRVRMSPVYPFLHLTRNMQDKTNRCFGAALGMAHSF